MTDESESFKLIGSDGNKYTVTGKDKDSAQHALDEHLKGTKGWGDTASDVMNTAMQGNAITGQYAPQYTAAVKAGLHVGKEGKDFSERYYNNLDDIRKRTAKFAEENPKTATGVKIAGGTVGAIPLVKVANTIAQGAGTIGNMAAQGLVSGTANVADRIAKHHVEGTLDKMDNLELLKSFGEGAGPAALAPGMSKAISPSSVVSGPAAEKALMRSANNVGQGIPRPGPELTGQALNEAASQAIKNTPKIIEQGVPHVGHALVNLAMTGAGAMHGGTHEALLAYLASHPVNAVIDKIKPHYMSNTFMSTHPKIEDALKALLSSTGTEGQRQFNP